MDAIQLQAMEKETNRRREAELKRINSAFEKNTQQGLWVLYGL